MAAVYSAVLGAANVDPSGDVTLYTAPAGIVAIVRDIRVRDRSGSGSGSVHLRAVVGGTPYVFYEVSTVTSGDSLQDAGRVVLEPGTQLVAHVGSGGCAFYVSGYELSAS